MKPATDIALSREDLRFRVPDTVSPEATGALTWLYGFFASRPKEGPPDSLAEWDRRRDRLEERVGPIGRQFVERMGAVTQADRLGDVPVLRIRPEGHRPTGRTLIYLHGGGYVVFSAQSALIIPALIASATGDEVISVDYTLAPHSTWQDTTMEVLSVWRGLLTLGVSPEQVGLFGDSAGGGLAAGSVLRMRDEGLALPGALYLLSPWSDLTATGDSYQTLADVDPSVDLDNLRWGADVYAAARNQKHPYVSPVYGDYGKAFPPTLIQGGTREMFLSDCVRLYQAIRSGGHQAVLDLYEGVPHVFQGVTAGSPETRTAIQRAADFFRAHLSADETLP